MIKPQSHATIDHDGTVKEVNGDYVLVSFSSGSACSGCHAESFCGMMPTVEKSVDIKGKYNVSPGDRVKITMEQSAGFKAVILGYVLPFIVLLTFLVIFNSLSFNELAAGLLSICSLLPYFIVLYLFRKKINRSFTFKLKTF